MRKTPALLMKELKAISKEIETILKDDKENSYAPLNNEMKIKYDNNYDYEANRKRIKELFDEENISFNVKRNFHSTITTVMLKNYNMPLKENVSDLLDKCVVLNTYLGNYFMGDIISNYDIFYRVDNFSDKSAMYVYDEEINFNYTNDTRCENCLHINELVVFNTDAQKDIRLETDYTGNLVQKDYIYDYVYKDLKNNLLKEASRR